MMLFCHQNFETFKMSAAKCYDRRQKKYAIIPQSESINNYYKFMGFVDLLEHNIGWFLWDSNAGK